MTMEHIMTMEHNIHSMYSHFWRDAYLAALQAGHADPAGAADEAFMAFDCRFGEPTDPPTEGLPPYEWKSDDEVLG